jgi:hypothetical protein
MRRTIAVFSLLALLGACTTARTGPQSAALDPVEAAAIDRRLGEVYAVISGPAGEERDWDRMRTLFTDDARLYAITPSGLSGGSVEDYITRSGPFLTRSGFSERQLARRVEIYGNLAHAWSSYEGSFTEPQGAPGSVRGINSFQLMRQSDGRWLVHSILWQAETPDDPLPADMRAGQ